jgi:hypothetical protein
MGNEFNRYSGLMNRINDAARAAFAPVINDPFQYDPNDLDLLLMTTEEWFGVRKRPDDPQTCTVGEWDQKIYQRFFPLSTDQTTILQESSDKCKLWDECVSNLTSLFQMFNFYDTVRDRLGKLQHKMRRIFTRISEACTDAYGMNCVPAGCVIGVEADTYRDNYQMFFPNKDKKNDVALTGSDAMGANVDKSEWKESAAEILLNAMGMEARKLGYYRKDMTLYEICMWPEAGESFSGLSYTPIRQYPVGAYEPVKEICTFLYEISRRDRNSYLYHYRLSSQGAVAHVLREFENNEEREAPRLERCRHAFSFTNCFYDAKTDYWSFHDQRDKKPLPKVKVRVSSERIEERDMVAAKFIRKPLTDLEPCGPPYAEHNGIYYDLDGKQIYNSHTKVGVKPIRSVMDIYTPNAETIFNDQGWEPLVKMWMYFMLGRLIFNVGQRFGGDNLQICPLLYGKAGTLVLFRNFFRFVCLLTFLLTSILQGKIDNRESNLQHVSSFGYFQFGKQRRNNVCFARFYWKMDVGDYGVESGVEFGIVALSTNGVWRTHADSYQTPRQERRRLVAVRNCGGKR